MQMLLHKYAQRIDDFEMKTLNKHKKIFCYYQFSIMMRIGPNNYYQKSNHYTVYGHYFLSPNNSISP